MIPQCIDQGIGVIPWSPLARGLLAGNRGRGGEQHTARAQSDAFAETLYKPELDWPVIDTLTALAQRREVPSAQVALAWLLHKPGVTAPIIGATQLHHLEDAIAAESLELDAEEIEQLESEYRPHEVAGLIGPSSTRQTVVAAR